MGIGGQFRRLRMWLCAIEDVGHGLAFIRRECGDIDKRLDPLRARLGDHPTGIGMSDKDNGPTDPLECPLERGHIVRQRRQRQRCGNRLQVCRAQSTDDFFQLEPSAQAPCARTAVEVIADRHRPLLSHRLQRTSVPAPAAASRDAGR